MCNANVRPHIVVFMRPFFIWPLPDVDLFSVCLFHVSFQVRFEFKTDNGSFMVSMKPPAEELLFPEPVSRAEFQRVLGGLGELDRETVEFKVSIA